MTDSGPAWLCYGDYVCLSTLAGKDAKERKYIIGHSSPLMQLKKLLTSPSDFASIILAENPATIAFSSVESGKNQVLDMVTNASDYWFEILPRTDYDMSTQLGRLKKDRGDLIRKKQQLEDKLSKTEKSNAVITSSPSDTLSVALNVKDDIHMSSQPPTDAMITVGSDAVSLEMQPLNSSSNPNSAVPAADPKNPTATSFFSERRRKSLFREKKVDDASAALRQEIETVALAIANCDKRYDEYKKKVTSEQKGNAGTIQRSHGEPVLFGAVIQLRHVFSKRLIAISKQVDRPVELAEYGSSGSLFYIERVSTGVAGGMTKVPASENISIRLRSFSSASQFLRLEPNISVVPGTKFPVSLDVELDGIFNADQCFQLGTGSSAPGDNRVEWVIERCRTHTSIASDDSSEADSPSDDVEDEGVSATEVLSGCQIIRLYHRASESYICAFPTKVDRGKVFFSHKSESDPSQGSGKISNSYWMVIDGDGDMEGSGEDMTTDKAIILQHVISGMVLVGIRHLPAIDSNRATNDEDYLSDDDSAADFESEEKALIDKQQKLSGWIKTFLKSIENALEYFHLPVHYGLTVSMYLDANDIADSAYEPKQRSFEDDEETPTKPGKCVMVEKWLTGGTSIQSFLNQARDFISNIDEITVQELDTKAIEIEYEIEKWIMSTLYQSPSGRKYNAADVLDHILSEASSDQQADNQSRSGRSGMDASASGQSLRLPKDGQSQGMHAAAASSVRDTSSVNGTEFESASHSGHFGKRETHPLHALEKHLANFKNRLQKSKKAAEGTSQNPWTFHIMTPKRIHKYRSRISDLLKHDLCAPFLISCRWSFSTKHEKIRRESSITNTTLFGLEVYDLSKDHLFLIGNQPARTSESNSSVSKSKRQMELSMFPLGQTSGKNLDPDVQSQMEMHLFNIEFVNAKSAETIKRGAQVSSIIRNFCFQLNTATEKRDLEFYLSFLRRYHSRLSEAFDVVTRSCVVNGFDRDCNINSADVDRQGQLFFGSLGIVELAFSVIQPFTEQLGWQIEEEPPFFTDWNVREHWAPVLHFTLSAISATTMTLPPNKADEFFKLWRRKDDSGKSWGDGQMLRVSERDQHHILEEMGFPSSHDEKGAWKPMVAHDLFRLFALANSIQGDKRCAWDREYSELGNRSPQKYVEDLMKQNFPKLAKEGFTKKVKDVQRFFKMAFSQSEDDDVVEDSSDKNEELLDVLTYAMKPSEFNYFFNKHLNTHTTSSLLSFKAVVSPALASRINRLVSEEDSLLSVPVGEHTFYLTIEEFANFFKPAKDQLLSEIVDNSSVTQVVAPWVSGLPCLPMIPKRISLPNSSFNTAKYSSVERCWCLMYKKSQGHLAKILKNVALDSENFDSPWNTLPIVFNFKDPVRYESIRPIIIEIIRKSLNCLTLLCKYCPKNQSKLTGSQMFYVVKNLFPKSAQNQLNVGSMLKSTLQGNFSVIDRMYTDAVYSSLLQIMHDSRVPAVPQVLESLMVDRNGATDYGQQMRVLKYAFKIPYQSGKILIPRLESTRKNGEIQSLKLIFDSTFALNKQKAKPTPKDHPFAFIRPPQGLNWAIGADGQKRGFIEPWDVLVPATERTGFQLQRYGKWCPETSFELKIFAQEYDVLEDFAYFSSLKSIEEQWNSFQIDNQNITDQDRLNVERDLKRDWWYCTMLFQLQYVCSCYSLVAKLCANRNIQAWNFFFEKQKQTKNDFFVQTWGSRPQQSIITHEGDLWDDVETHCTFVDFNSDSFSTVAAVSNIKPGNPSCAYENQFPTRKFMYYEVSIESEPDEKSMLQIGWTVASRERNADHASDGDGTGDFPHSWGIDCIRSISYDSAEKLLESYDNVISVEQNKLATLIPAAKDFLQAQVKEIRENRRKQIEFTEIDRLWNEVSVSMKNDGRGDQSKSIEEAVECAKLLLRTKISLRRSLIAHMRAAKTKFEKEQTGLKFESWKKGSYVDRGLLCFHSPDPSLIPDSTSSYMSDDIERQLNSDKPPSLRWGLKKVIGVWIDMDAMEIGIVRPDILGGKQTLFRRSDTSYFEDKNDMKWKESDIVPCISGRGIKIKVNLGILEGKSNDFQFFDEEKLNFCSNKDFDAKPRPIASVKNGKFSTPEAHSLKHNQFIRLEFPEKKTIEPQQEDDGSYSLENHGLKQNEFVHFDYQSVWNGIEEGDAYVVQLVDGDDNRFRLLKCSLKEKEPYRVKLENGNSNQFEVLPASLPDAVYCSDSIMHPRVILKGEVGRADWGPYGENPVDVTDIYNNMYASGIRQFGYVEVVKEDGSITEISGGLKHFFQPKDANGKVLFEGMVCYLRIFSAIKIPDIDIVDMSYASCTGFVAPTRVSAKEIANFAFADGSPVIPNYQMLSDIIFCSSLPVCLRSSCAELLRSCFIDQEPWFLTPPVNTLRAIQAPGHSSPPAVRCGAYDETKFVAFGYIPRTPTEDDAEADQDFFKDLHKESDEKFCFYNEFDDKFFIDLYNAARTIGSQNNDAASKFLLRGYKYPPGPFQLSTRDVVIFWGRATCQLWDTNLKEKFISKKNQDCKIFFKNIILCLLDTLLFEFDESWTGVIAVRSLVVKDLELCILSYFQQIDVAQSIADNIKQQNSHRPSDTPGGSADFSFLAKLVSCFRHDLQSTDDNFVDALQNRSMDDAVYTSRVPEAVRQSALYVDDKLLEEMAKLKPEDRILLAKAKKIWMTLNESTGSVVESKSSKLLTLPSDILQKEADSLKEYTEYSIKNGNFRFGSNPGSFGYIEWPLQVVSPGLQLTRFSHSELKSIFKEASGSMLLALCNILEVCWQVMIDDKISDFIRICTDLQRKFKAVGSELRLGAPSTRQLQQQQSQLKAIESTTLKTALKEFFEKEKSNETKLNCKFVNEDNQVLEQPIDWFDVIPCLSQVSRAEVRNMASKLTIQLHSFPKVLFESLTKTEIVIDRESEILNDLQSELGCLRLAKDSIRMCFFSENDMLESYEIPNEVSCNLGTAWMAVERLIAQLSRKEDYERSLAEVQSWVEPSVARIFVPLDEYDDLYDEAMRIVGDSGGIPDWEQSIEFIDMLQEALADVKFCPVNQRNWQDKPDESPYFMVNARPNLHENGRSQICWNKMQVYSKKLDVEDSSDNDNSPAIREYTCCICNEEGNGYCFCFPDDPDNEWSDLSFVHPNCVYKFSMAGPKDNFFHGLDPPVIPSEISSRFRDVYDSNKADQDVTRATQRKKFVIDQVKQSIPEEYYLDHVAKGDDAENSKLRSKKVTQLKKAMTQLGIIRQLMDIVKLPFPKKFTQAQCDQYNRKMQRRMDSRRIPYLYENNSATYERVTVIENLDRRIFGLLAIAATNYTDIQDLLYEDISFLFTKALEPTVNDAALCISKLVEGNIKNAADVSVDLLSSMVKVAQDGQNPDDILLLKPFLAQGDKNISINQREILELLLPSELSNIDDCMFVLDSDYPSESVDLESYEKWKRRLQASHIPPSLRGNLLPWPKDHNWKHLFRVASDIVTFSTVHGGFASVSEPCRSAFHMAFIQTLISSAFNNSDERQNIVLRLPFDQVLHIINTVCRTVFHRIWGQSFLNRVKLLSGDPQFSDISNTTFNRDPRLDFLNFDKLIKFNSNEFKQLEILPVLGVLKFVNIYMDLVFNVHFFSEASDDLVRRTPQGLPLITSSDKGFITWMEIILQSVIRIFSFKNSSELSEVDLTQESSGAGVSGALTGSAQPSMGEICSSPSSFVPRSFKDIDSDWYRVNGDVSVEDFDLEVSHHFISVCLNQIWTNIFGLEVDYETKVMQGKKMADEVANDSRKKDLFVSKKFCRPFWRCPISHSHFTKENNCVLAMAVNSILFDSVSMDWKSKDPKKMEPEKKPSILGALNKSPMGYASSTSSAAPAFRPNCDDIAEANCFILAIELLIQEMYQQQPGIDIKPLDVVKMVTDEYSSVLSWNSFASRSAQFVKHLQDDDASTSWPIKLRQSSNQTAAILLIEKKISQWNIIRLFDKPSSSDSTLYRRFSAIQRPVIRRCFEFAVSNWGGWGGLGSEISLSVLSEITDSIGFALKDICQITLDTFPLFIQQLFLRYEAPKSGSKEALEYRSVGEAFQRLAAVLEKDQCPSITKFCNLVRETHNVSPLEYLKHVGDMLQKAPNAWSSIEVYLKPKKKTTAPGLKSNNQDSSSKSDDLSNVDLVLSDISVPNAAKLILSDKKIDEVVRLTLDKNAEEMMFRFLAIDTSVLVNPVDDDEKPFCFFSQTDLIRSTNRDRFPQYLTKMVYNTLNVFSTANRLPRGEDTNKFLETCLRVMIQTLYVGACVNMDEAKCQLAKLAKNKLVVDETDSDSLLARVVHLQECIAGLRWLSADELQELRSNSKSFAVQSLCNPTPVTDPSYTVALKSLQCIAKLITSSAPTVEVQILAMQVLSCLLDHCSTSVLDRLFDSKDTQVIHSPSNVYARSLKQFIKDYEDFQDRDDDLSYSLEQFKLTHGEGGSDDEFILKLIEFETTDWNGEANAAREQKREPKFPEEIIKEAYEKFCSKGFHACLYSLRLICQMCVQSGKMTRSSYVTGQKYMMLQSNSDPASIVSFPSVLNSLGAEIAGRLRLGNANIFDIRVLCRLFKSLNAIVFGQSSSDTIDLLSAETFNLINKCVSGLSQRIDDFDSPFFPGNHPIYVLEQMLMFLLSFALSDIDGQLCLSLSKGTSWINFFNLIFQIYSAAGKSSAASSTQSKPFQIPAKEYRSVACRVCDSAYILYSAVKRRDIEKSAQLEKDWIAAGLEGLASECQRRVSCVEIVRTPGYAELCFFTNPDNLGEVGDNTQTTLLCLEESRQLSLRKNLVICEQLRNRKISNSGTAARVFKILRNVPLIITTLINLLLLGWLNLPIDFSQASEGWKWPQDELLWERLVPKITSEDGSYSYEEFQNEVLPNVLPLFVPDDHPDATNYRNGINMTFLLLAGANILICFVNLLGWLKRNASIEVYEYLLTMAYDEFSSNKKKKVSLEELQAKAGGSSFFMILRLPAFWGRLMMFVCSLCILLVSPLFSILFVCDGFRFPGISYIFGAFSSKSKEFLTLGYLTASIIFINAVIGLVFFWDIMAPGDGEESSSECTSLFQCTLSFLVLGWQGGGLSDLLQATKNLPQGTPREVGNPSPDSYRLIIALMWQLLYFIVVPTCLVSTVVGIISDSFGDARQQKADWKQTMADECFVCGRTAADFRDAALFAGLPEESIVTFEEHVTTEHSVKDYFKLFMGVKGFKNPDLLTAQEHFVLQKINSLDESFFPMDLSISLDAMKSFAESESSTAEKQEKRLNGIEQDIGKLSSKFSEKIDEVQSSLLKLLNHQESMN